MPTLGVFPAAQAVADLNDPSESDDDPSFAGNTLTEIFFASSRDVASVSSIYRAVSADDGDTWTDVSLVGELSGAFADDAPRLMPDGLTMTFASNRPLSNRLDLFTTTRPDDQSQWENEDRIDELMDLGGEKAGVLSTDRLRLYFCIENGDGTEDVALAERSATDQPFGTAQVIDFGLSDNECDPWLSESELVIVFTANTTTAGRDLFTATRPDRDSDFGPATNAPFANINGNAEELDPWLSPDLQTMYFSSTRAGSQDIYRSRIP